MRDLYDVFFLLRYITNIDSIKPSLVNLIKDFKKPIDEGDLKVVILEGLVPETDKMIEYIKGRVKWGKRSI